MIREARRHDVLQNWFGRMGLLPESSGIVRMLFAPKYSDVEAAEALIGVLGNSEWIGVQLAKGAMALDGGVSAEDAAEQIFREGPLSRVKCRELLQEVERLGFLAVLTPRSDGLFRESDHQALSSDGDRAAFHRRTRRASHTS